MLVMETLGKILKSCTVTNNYKWIKKKALHEKVQVHFSLGAVKCGKELWMPGSKRNRETS